VAVADKDEVPVTHATDGSTAEAAKSESPREQTAMRDLQRGLLMERTGNVLIFGGPLMFAGAVLLLAYVFPQLEDMGPAALAILAIFPFGFVLSMYVAFKLAYLGKQYQARARAMTLKLDTRPPVVYLRPFAADESLGKLFRKALGRGVWPRFGSTEEQLGQVLEPVGPLVAIGTPGESLPTPGAIRRYAGDSDWKSIVESWLAGARLIVLRPGFSEGLWWEVREAVARSDPGKLIILMMRMRRRDYLRFAQRVQGELGKTLPAFDAVSRWRAVNGFVQFGPDWEASFRALRAPLLRGDVTLPLRAPFHYALKPVLERLGVPWQPARLSATRVIAAALIGVALVVMFLAWLMQ
jgi:hypothetical protein